MKRTPLALSGIVAAALSLLAVTPANAAESSTITVPNDFVTALSDTRATGHYEVVIDGLRIWTEGNTGTDKVAEYVSAKVALADIGEPSLEYSATTGTIPPGFQLIVDLDGDGVSNGILVGEKAYGDVWWLSNSAVLPAGTTAPTNDAATGSSRDGTLDQWRSAYPDAVVTAFGFSLGSGVLGDGVISSLTFAGTRYSFAEAVTLKSKDECKNGGWSTSTAPEFKNQGECVSSFASVKNAK